MVREMTLGMLFFMDGRGCGLYCIDDLVIFGLLSSRQLFTRGERRGFDTLDYEGIG